MRLNLHLLISLAVVFALVFLRQHAFSTYHRYLMKKQPQLYCSLAATCPQFLAQSSGFLSHVQQDLKQIEQHQPHHPILKNTELVTNVHQLMPLIDKLLRLKNHLSPTMKIDNLYYTLKIPMLDSNPFNLEIYFNRTDSVYTIDSISGLAEFFMKNPAAGNNINASLPDMSADIPTE
jgi:hypothetical protein